MAKIVAKHNVVDHDEHDEHKPVIIAIAGEEYQLTYNLYVGEDGGAYNWNDDDFTYIP